MDRINPVRETLTAMFNDKLKAKAKMNGGILMADQLKAVVKEEGRDLKSGRFVKGNTVATKHGAVHYLTSGRLQGRANERLRKEMKRIRLELERMLSRNGGGITPKETLLIQQVIKTFGFCSVFERFLEVHGVLDPNTLKKKVVTFQPGFTTYLSLLSRQNTALTSLGLSVEEKEKILTPFEIIQEEEKAK